MFAFLLFMANKSNSSVQFLGESMARQSAFWFYLTFSMTQLLSHIIAPFTGLSFMLKTNNQLYKKKLYLAFSWVNVVKNCKILTFKVNFLCQKLSESFQKKFSLNNINLGAHILLLTVLTTSTFIAHYFLKWRPFFDGI